MHPYINIATTAALKASEIIIRYFDRVDRLSVREKAPHDYVSNVDTLSEEIIIDTIQRAYPQHGIIGEESGQIVGQDNITWIIDPLDGTTNYLHALPHFAISIAVQHNDRIEHGVIYDPIRRELFTASIGRGAQLNNHRIRVSSQTDINKAMLVTRFPCKRHQLTEQYITTFSELSNTCASIRRTGSAALDLAYLAAGRLDGIWEFSLKSWDIAAGAIMVREAGGIISDPLGEENYLESGQVVAGNPRIYRSLLQTLKPILGTKR